MTTRKAAEEMRHVREVQYYWFIMLIEKSVLCERVETLRLPLVSVVPTLLLRLVSSWMDRPPGPERHAAYEDIFGRRPAPPHWLVPTTALKTICRLQIHKDKYHTRPNQYQRPPAPPYHPIRTRTHTSRTHNSSSMRRNTATVADTQGSDPPAYGRQASTLRRDVPAGEAGAAVEALGVACPTTAFARVAAIGPTCAESGVLRLGRAGVIGNGDANGNGIEEAGEEDNAESELPWARRCARTIDVVGGGSGGSEVAGALAGSIQHEARGRRELRRWRRAMHPPTRHSFRFAWWKRKRASDGLEGASKLEGGASFEGGWTQDMGAQRCTKCWAWAVRDAQRLIAHVLPQDVGGNAQDEGRRLGSAKRGELLLGIRYLALALKDEMHILSQEDHKLVYPHSIRVTSSHAARTPSALACFVLHSSIHPAALYCDGGSHTASHSPSSVGRYTRTCSGGARHVHREHLRRLGPLDNARSSRIRATCGPANGLRFGFLALGLGISREGMRQDGTGRGRLHRGGVVCISGPRSSVLPICVSDSGHADGDVPRDFVNRCRWDAAVGAGVWCKGHFVCAREGSACCARGDE
ncbi:hypothetical protein B0H13DRAFT_2280302 [Mycena leptocephala]|nr:hypothetical protein B0H13DRAFT_2280302 [Mycena leptocephala]